ncbi:MAG: hypothetical protein K2Q20_08620, partial [Phycisphaerales bacterium]|nr:hypothetical protein [Phycisphaerales bacterium]
MKLAGWAKHAVRAALFLVVGLYFASLVEQHVWLPGSRRLWAMLGGVAVAAGLAVQLHVLGSLVAQRFGEPAISDARGTPRPAAFVASRGLVVPAEFPADLRQAIATAGAANFFSHLRWPPVRAVLVPVAMAVVVLLLTGPHPVVL